MKIGIISDTHDDVDNVRKAIKIFNERNVELVIHAGDYVFPGVVQEFKALKGAKLVGVLGNNDGERTGLLRRFLEVGGQLLGELGELEIDSIKLGIYHGTSEEIKQMLASSKKYDVLICGHTHKKEPKENRGRVGEGTFILNPGSAHRMVKNIPVFEQAGIMILDTQTKEYDYVQL